MSDELLASLDAAAVDGDGWPVERCDLDALRRGAVRAYRRGRREMARAQREPATERRLHEWPSA